MSKLIQQWPNSGSAVEEYFLEHGINGDELIEFCLPILCDKTNSLFADVLFLFDEIPNTAALSDSRSSGWKFDALKACQNLAVLNKIIDTLDNPSYEIKKAALRAIRTFVVYSVYSEKSSNGFPTFFHLGKHQIELVALNDIKLYKIKKLRSRTLRRLSSEILRQIREFKTQS